MDHRTPTARKTSKKAMSRWDSRKGRVMVTIMGKRSVKKRYREETRQREKLPENEVDDNNMSLDTCDKSAELNGVE